MTSGAENCMIVGESQAGETGVERGENTKRESDVDFGWDGAVRGGGKG
jgi:hypothetical protein